MTPFLAPRVLNLPRLCSDSQDWPPKANFNKKRESSYLIGSKALLNWMIQCVSSSRRASIATHTLCLVISRASVTDSVPWKQLQGMKVGCRLVNSHLHYFRSASVLLSECTLREQAAANCRPKLIIIQICISQHLPNKDFSAVCTNRLQNALQEPNIINQTFWSQKY